ncbi:hypothetical protein V8E52_003226 [Russula decolorans]
MMPMPANQQPQIAQLEAQFAQIQDQIAQIQDQYAQIDNRLAEGKELLSIRLWNATMRPNETLQYPPAVAIQQPMPNTKVDLLYLTAAQCVVVAEMLHLPALERGAVVADRRQQISNYLGCAMVF